jgi:hypothetical protein
MGTNSTQAFAILFFLTAFVFLAGAMAAGGNVGLILLFLAGIGASIALFLRVKPWEDKYDGGEYGKAKGPGIVRKGAASADN